MCRLSLCLFLQITESRLQELKNRHPTVGCSFRLGMYFETLHQADSFDPLVDPEVYSSCYETDLDEETGLGSLIYDRVNGDSASTVNLTEVEDILHKRDERVTFHVLPSINETLETDRARGHSVDSCSPSYSTVKDSHEAPKSWSSQNSQDSGRESNDSSKRSHRKLSAEGRKKTTKDKSKEVNLKTAVVRSLSKEKPTTRAMDHQPVASTAKRSINHGLPKRAVVGGEGSHYIEPLSKLKSMKIASDKSPARKLAASQEPSQTRYSYPTFGTHQSASPVVSHNRYASQPVTTSACKVPVSGARRPSSQHRYLGFV